MKRKIFIIIIDKVLTKIIVDTLGRRWNKAFFRKTEVKKTDAFRIEDKHWPRTGKRRGLHITRLLGKIPQK